MTSTLVRKTWMALTGLFLCLFLAVHLAGNLQLFLPEGDAREGFNAYAEFLAGLPVIRIAAWGTYLAVIGHGALALVLAVRNRRAVGEGAQSRDAGLAPWTSRSMGALGAVILVFLVVHLKDFWWPFKFGGDLALDPDGRRDLFGLVALEFQKGWKVALYVVGVLAVGAHLAHGFYSGLRTLGLSHPGYARWARRLGLAFAVVVTVGFAAMPVFLYLAR